MKPQTITEVERTNKHFSSCVNSQRWALLVAAVFAILLIPLFLLFDQIDYQIWRLLMFIIVFSVLAGFVVAIQENSGINRLHQDRVDREITDAQVDRDETVESGTPEESSITDELDQTEADNAS